ncbi:hypothetical protein [Sphingobacterium thermophilum]
MKFVRSYRSYFSYRYKWYEKYECTNRRKKITDTHLFSLASIHRSAWQP